LWQEFKLRLVAARRPARGSCRQRLAGRAMGQAGRPGARRKPPSQQAPAARNPS